MDALEGAKCCGKGIHLISALKWKCHGVAHTEVEGSRTLQTCAMEQCLAGTISVMLPNTSKAMQQQAGEEDYPRLQVVNQMLDLKHRKDGTEVPL